MGAGAGAGVGACGRVRGTDSERTCATDLPSTFSRPSVSEVRTHLVLLRTCVSAFTDVGVCACVYVYLCLCEGSKVCLCAGVTEQLREYLRNMPKMIMQQQVCQALNPKP